MNIALAIILLLQVVQSLLTQFKVGSRGIDTVLSALVQLVPIVAQEAAIVVPAIRNLIAAIQADGDLTADQIAALDKLSADVDAAFDAALAAYAKRSA